ncbi:MAG: hypothetical protein J5709_00555 [Bacteroidales bacterium]|nr:hypothetical protein [Bacteroidales bacterium]
MKRIDLLKYAIYVLAVCALAMFNSGCEKENLKEDCLSNVNCKYVFYKDMEDYDNRLREIITMTREERERYELSQGYESFGTYCEKLYESINPESFRSFDEVVTYVEKNKDYLELIEDENGEYTLEVVNRNKIERYMYGVDKIFVIKDSAYKVLDDNMVSCSAKLIADLTKINEDNYMSYINNPQFTFIVTKTNSSDICCKDIDVNNGTYEKDEVVNGTNKTRTEIIIEYGSYFDGVRRCHAGVKVRPLKKTAGTWFWCTRTIDLHTDFFVHYKYNNIWYETTQYSYYSTQKGSVHEYSIWVPNYVQEAHFGRVYAYGDTPDTNPAIINHW